MDPAPIFTAVAEDLRMDPDVLLSPPEPWDFATYDAKVRARVAEASSGA